MQGVSIGYDCDSDSSEYEDESVANDSGQWLVNPPPPPPPPPTHTHTHTLFV